MTPRSRSGFTLLELMIVVTIIGILMALSVAAAQRIGTKNATQNAASDIGSILQNARARAEQRGTDVYVIVFPTMTAAGALTGGGGALFVFEDGNGNFLKSTGTCTTNGAAGSDCNFANFLPPNIYSPSTSPDRFVQAIYLDNYPKKNVIFGKPAGVAYTAPFTGLPSTVSNGCTFCSTGTTAKGALVFTGEQQMMFVDGSGAVVAARTAGLALQSKDNPKNNFLFGLVSATGLVTLVK